MNKLLRDLQSSAFKLTDYLISTGNCHKCSQNPSRAALMRSCCGFVCSLGLGMRAQCWLLAGAVPGQTLGSLTQLTWDLAWRLTHLPCSQKPQDSLQGNRKCLLQTCMVRDFHCSTSILTGKDHGKRISVKSSGETMFYIKIKQHQKSPSK